MSAEDPEDDSGRRFRGMINSSSDLIGAVGGGAVGLMGGPAGAMGGALPLA